MNDVMRSLEPIDARLWRLRSRSARKLLRSNRKISVAIWAALVQAMDWPDTTVVGGLVIGFPTVGHYPETGIFRQCDRPAKHAFESLNHYDHNRHLESVLRRLAASDLLRPRVQQAIEETDRLTWKEVAYNNMDGPFYTTEEVDRKLGVAPNSWRALHRFAPYNKAPIRRAKVKRRCCDNGRTSGTNDCLDSRKTITCERASYPAVVARLVAEA
jgi:hypothetical protein